MFRRILAAAVLLALAAVLVIAVWPQLLGLERTPVIAQLVSLRAAAVALAAVLVVAFTLVALASAPPAPLRRLGRAAAARLLRDQRGRAGHARLRGRRVPDDGTR